MKNKKLWIIKLALAVLIVLLMPIQHSWADFKTAKHAPKMMEAQ